MYRIVFGGCWVRTGGDVTAWLGMEVEVAAIT